MKREDILAVYAAGPDAVVALVEQLLAAHQEQAAELTTRIERLEARLNQDSHNSHKPPSSDVPAKLPPDITEPAQYGPGVKALAVYLQTYQHLPFERTQEYFRDVHQLSLSEGTLATTQAVCAEQLAPVEQAIRAGVTQAAVAHFDE